jgi:hypothetical protein
MGIQTEVLMTSSLRNPQRFIASWMWTGMCVALALSALVNRQAHGQLTLEWLQTINRPSFGFGIARATDESIYITGLLTLHSSDSQIFVARFDAEGNLQWIRVAVATMVEPFIHASGNDIAVDGAGDVYVTGVFWGDTDLDGDGTLDLVTPRQELEVFLAKFDAQGKVIWANHLVGTGGGAESAGSSKLAVDAAGNAYVTADFQHAADFDNDGVDDLTCAEHDCLFLARYDRDGTFQMAVGTSGNTADSEGITLDPSGNVILTGIVGGRVVFDSAIDRGVVGVDFRSSAFVAKYTALGKLLWVRAQTAPGPNLAYVGQGVAADNAGAIYVTGYFDAGEALPERRKFLLTKYDAAGNFLWSRTAGPGRVVGYGLVASSNGAIYVGGDYDGSADFDGDGIADVPDAPASHRLFLAKYDRNGAFQDVAAISSFSEGSDMLLDPTGGILLTGRFASAGVVKYVDGADHVIGTIAIDVRPDDPSNAIPCTNRNFRIRVAILTTDRFNAMTVDPSSVRFAGAPEIRQRDMTLMDIDGDGDFDLVVHVRLGATKLTCFSDLAFLEAITFSGQRVVGSDRVWMIR